MTIRAFDFVTSQPWALPADALTQIIDIIERHGDDGRIEALATRIGEPLRNTRTVEDRNGVAVVPVIGPIFRYANLFTELSGATSTQVLATDIQTALDDPSIRGLVLSIDSPGGHAHGINELAQMIFDARGKKPIVAYADGPTLSGAYWLASAADEVHVDGLATLGSIGVVMTFFDSRQRDERSGIRRHEIVSSDAPDKRIDPTTDEGRAKVQAVVDELGTVFVEAVARNRGVTTDTVRADFGRGGVLVGRSAVAAGMADRLGSLESVIAKIVGETGKKFSLARRIETMGTQKTVSVVTTEELRDAAAKGYTVDQIEIKEPDLKALRAEAHAAGMQAGEKKVAEQIPAATEAGKKEGATAERARIKAIQASTMPGFEKEVEAAIDDGSSVEAASVALLKAARERGVSLSSIAADSTKVPHAAAPGGKVSSWGKITKRFGAKA